MIHQRPQDMGGIYASLAKRDAPDACAVKKRPMMLATASLIGKKN
jgi:hypothetical protein